MTLEETPQRRPIPRGIQPSVVLPFRENASVDWEAYRSQVAHALSDPRVSGLLINGHASDNALTTDDEKDEIIRVTRAASPRDVFLTTGVYAESTARAARQAQRLEAAGADALLVFQPNGWALGCDPASILEHHQAIHDATTLPIMLYQASVHAGSFAYPLDVLDKLVKLERVLGVKEGSWEINVSEVVRRRIKSVRPDIAVYGSGDEHLIYNYLMGTDGSQASIAAVVPGLVCDLWDSAAAQDWTRAKEIHEVLQPLAAMIYGTQPGARVSGRLKSCLRTMGVLPNDRVRLPLVSIPAAEAEMLTGALENIRRFVADHPPETK